MTLAPESALTFVQSEVDRAPVVLFAKSYCPYSAKAKQALAALNLTPSPSKYIIHDIDQRPDEAEIQEALAVITGAGTVPRLFIGGKFVGGGDTTVKLASSGQLREMVQAAT